MKRSIVFAGRLAAHKLGARKTHPADDVAEAKSSVTKSSYLASSANRDRRQSRQELQQGLLPPVACGCSCPWLMA